MFRAIYSAKLSSRDRGYLQFFTTAVRTNTVADHQNATEQHVAQKQQQIKVINEKQAKLAEWQTHRQHLNRQAQSNRTRLNLLYKLPELTPQKAGSRRSHSLVIT